MGSKTIQTDLIEQGIKEKLIRLEDNGSYIVYLHENIRRNYKNPEEKVQAETYIQLISAYGYPAKRVKQFVRVTMGREVKEADLIVYTDDTCTKPYIVVECKKQETTEQEYNQAIRQACSYAHAVAGTIKYVWVSSGIKDSYYLIDKDNSEPKTVTDIPRYGSENLSKYKYYKGGIDKKGQKVFDLETVSQDELTRRFELAHQALWGGGALNPSTAFDELDKLIFCKIIDETRGRPDGEPYDFQISTEDTEVNTNIRLYERIISLYEEGRKIDPEVFKDDIKLDSTKIRTVVGYLEGISLSDTDLDSKGRAFETFMGSFFRGDFGQYFTPRTIVDFIVKVLPITNTSMVLDTSCGSGGFLLYALDKIRKQADAYFDVNKTTQSKKHYKFWHDFAANNLYGIEINEQIARVAKMNMIIHDDGHTNVVTSDGLWPDDEVAFSTKNHGFKYGRFDCILTNPPFGSIIKQAEQDYYKKYHMVLKDVDWLNPKSKASERPAQSTEVLFIEQCHNYLKEGGYLAIVIPDGILSNSSMQYVRDNIEELYRIVAIVSMPQTAFASTGAGVKSSVLFMRKYTEQRTKEIRDAKQRVKDQLKTEQNYSLKLSEIERDKATHIKSLNGLVYDKTLSMVDLKKTEAFKEWLSEVNGIYQSKLGNLKDTMTDLLAERQKNQIVMQNIDYQIFMAIANDIGYDATGKPTGINELNEIADKLSHFLVTLDN